MEGQNIFRSIRFPLSHLPTFFLVIGYPIFWLELYVFKVGHGQTTPGAWTIFSIFAFIAIFQNHSQITAGLRNFQTWFKEESSSVKALLVAAGIAAGVIFLSALYASFLPPHLVQEFDAINYHITLPRQHLLLGSFGHIPWSSADLYFLPIDFALAPFWLATSLPNKLPQFFFVIGLLAVSGRLAWRFSGGKTWPVMLVVLAILGSHNIGIQAGTAMLDIAICYLFLAALDSFLSGAIWLGIIEISFYFWSKPLIPAQVIVTVALFGLAWLILRACGIRKNIWVIAGEKTEERMGDTRLTLAKGIGFFLIISSLPVSIPLWFDWKFLSSFVKRVS